MPLPPIQSSERSREPGIGTPSHSHLEFSFVLTFDHKPHPPFHCLAACCMQWVRFWGVFSLSIPSMSVFSAFGPKTHNTNGSGGPPASHPGVSLCAPAFPLGGNETGLRLHPATGDNVNPACSSTILSSFSLHVPVKSNKVLKEKRGGCLANHTTQKVCHFAPHPLGQSPGSRNVFLVFFPIFLTQILTIFAMYSPPHHKRGAEGAKKQSPVESPQQVG